MNNYINEFEIKVKELLETVDKEESKNIKAAAEVIFSSMIKDKVLHVFATGHSHMFAEELFYRAGGLIQVNPVLAPFLMQHEGAVSSTKYERLEGVAKIIYEGLDLKEGEVFIIVSNSGINAVPIEMAKIVKENKHPLIVITSIDSSKKLTSRVKDNSHLYDYADIVIDNHAPLGDTIINTKYGNIGSVSSIIGSYIAQKLVIEIVSLYEKNNLVPSIYQSANVQGGDEHNKKAFEEYKKRIRSLY
ncbi:MAG: SIS domain-containing protein [Bacilli bacterium]|nr:SIS domain-containing protein [Bacilli bacterium]